MSRRARAARGKADSNQKLFIDIAKAKGAHVVVLSAVGGGVPDLLIGHLGRTLFVELKTVNPYCKDGRLKKGVLRDAQKVFISKFPNETHVFWEPWQLENKLDEFDSIDNLRGRAGPTGDKVYAHMLSRADKDLVYENTKTELLKDLGISANALSHALHNLRAFKCVGKTERVNVDGRYIDKCRWQLSHVKSKKSHSAREYSLCKNCKKGFSNSSFGLCRTCAQKKRKDKAWRGRVIQLHAEGFMLREIQKAIKDEFGKTVRIFRTVRHKQTSIAGVLIKAGRDKNGRIELEEKAHVRRLKEYG